MTGHLVMEEIMSGSVAAPINSAKVQSASGLRQFVPLTWLALGTFATGTESFMASTTTDFWQLLAARILLAAAAGLYGSVKKARLYFLDHH
jgi:hypothetical protein